MQSQILSNPTVCNAGGWRDLLTITTTQAGRLLVLWNMTATTNAGAPRTVSSRVVVNGVPQGPSVSTVLDNNISPRTIAGQALVTAAAPVASTVILQCTSTLGGVFAAAPAATTLSVMELH